MHGVRHRHIAGLHVGIKKAHTQRIGRIDRLVYKSFSVANIQILFINPNTNAGY